MTPDQCWEAAKKYIEHFERGRVTKSELESKMAELLYRAYIYGLDNPIKDDRPEIN